MRRHPLSFIDAWPIAMVIVAVFAAAVLLPGLGDFGLWDPQERALADKEAPGPELARQHADAEAKQEALAAAAKAKQAADIEAKAKAAAAAAEKAGKPPPPRFDLIQTAPACLKTADKDPIARSLTGKAAALGRDVFDDSDAGRRLPVALLGLLTVVALAGTTLRLATPRAAILAGVVALSMPLLVLQSRQLTSEIGTACGGALIIYGLVALGGLCFSGVVARSATGRAFTRPSVALVLVDGLVGALAFAAGVVIGFAGGGALLGLAVPLGAFALAGGLGAPAFGFGWRVCRELYIIVLGAISPRLATGRRRPLRYDGAWSGVVAIGAALAAIAVLAVIAYEIYELKDPMFGTNPVQRTVFGKVIAASGCWSPALGGTWRADDDLKAIFDSTWEQIAYGTYPWGLIAPVAIGWLIASGEPRRRKLGGLALAWAGVSWLATEAFQRKVGFALWAGFPALAIAVGAWLDAILSGVRTETAGVERESGFPRGAMLVGIYMILATLDIGKDVQEFSDKLSSLLVGGDGVPYPSQAHILLIPAKLWVLLLGMLVAFGLGLSMILWRDGKRAMQQVALAFGAASIAATVLLAAFWSSGWQPAIVEHVSSKVLFESYLERKQPTDTLVVMGDLGDAARDYAPDEQPEVLTSRDQIVKAIGRPNRVFAIAPQSDLCQLHREIGGKPYFVVDDRNVRSLLLSNRLDQGDVDKNPLATAIVHSEPKDIPTRPKAKIVWDNKVQLLGWDIPPEFPRSDKVTITMFYKILQPVGGSWKVIFHFDGAAGRGFNGDHPPINDRCPTSTWQPGDYIIDTYTLTAGNSATPTGKYEVWSGFFTGTAPNFKNMPISEAPGDVRDPAGTDRIKVTTINLE